MVRGGAAKETDLTPREREICATIGPELKRPRPDLRRHRRDRRPSHRDQRHLADRHSRHPAPRRPRSRRRDLGRDRSQAPRRRRSESALMHTAADEVRRRPKPPVVKGGFDTAKVERELEAARAAQRPATFSIARRGRRDLSARARGGARRGAEGARSRRQGTRLRRSAQRNRRRADPRAASPCAPAGAARRRGR